MPFLDIISAAETCTIDLENNIKEIDSECLLQNVSHILKRNLNIKLQGNLSKSQRKAFVQINNNKDTKIYPFDKSSGFLVLPEKKHCTKN